MKSNKLYFLNKDIILLLVTLFLSLSLFFSNESIYVKKIEEKIIDFVSFIVYPKTWYENILIVESLIVVLISVLINGISYLLQKV